MTWTHKRDLKQSKSEILKPWSTNEYQFEILPEIEDAVVTQIEILIEVENVNEVDISLYLRNDRTNETVTIFEQPSF